MVSGRLVVEKLPGSPGPKLGTLSGGDVRESTASGHAHVRHVVVLVEHVVVRRVAVQPLGGEPVL